ncbi:hypothetical protein [Achromobacter piechaudii]|uniref:hypothetical protein n=1 Tax=Achromobacter piechaudii TaxID=72556 RepID=UPI001428B32C|nr:hypothetical protein [Achromobacter piechaudii]
MKQTLNAPASTAVDHRRLAINVRMQGSFLILFASEPPRGTCQLGQAALARHLLMTLVQHREEVCNKVLPRRFKAQRPEQSSTRMKKRAAVGALGLPSEIRRQFAAVTRLNGV